MSRIPPSEVLRKGVHIGAGFLALALRPLGPRSPPAWPRVPSPSTSSSCPASVAASSGATTSTPRARLWGSSSIP